MAEVAVEIAVAVAVAVEVEVAQAQHRSPFTIHRSSITAHGVNREY